MLFSSLKILFAFVLGCIVSFGSMMIAVFSVFFKEVPFFGGGGRARFLWETLILGIGVVVMLSIFPLLGFVFKKDFSAVQPSWLPKFAFIIIFSLSPIIILMCGYFALNFYFAYQTWHPRNGEETIYYEDGKIKTTRNWKNGLTDGELVHYCPDGSITYKGFYVGGKPIGEEIREDCGSFQKHKEVNRYDQSSKLIESEKYYNGKLSEYWSKNGNIEILRKFYDSNKLLSEQQNDLGSKTMLYREYNEDGSIRLEKHSNLP